MYKAMKVIHFYLHFKAWIVLQIILWISITSLAIPALYASIG